MRSRSLTKMKILFWIFIVFSVMGIDAMTSYVWVNIQWKIGNFIWNRFDKFNREQFVKEFYNKKIHPKMNLGPVTLPRRRTQSGGDLLEPQILLDLEGKAESWSVEKANRETTFNEFALLLWVLQSFEWNETYSYFRTFHSIHSENKTRAIPQVLYFFFLHK